MSYLARLALKAAGLAQGVRPRVRSRFEPVRAAELALEREVIPSNMQEGSSPQAPSARPRIPPAHEHEHEPARRDRAEATHAAPPRRASEVAERVTDVLRSEVTTTSTLITERAPTPSTQSQMTRHLTLAQPIADGQVASPLPRLVPEPPLAFGGAIRARQGAMDSVSSDDRDGANPTDRTPGVDSGVRHVHVTIGRVEVRAVASESGARQPTALNRPTPLSLDEYLRRRGPP